MKERLHNRVGCFICNYNKRDYVVGCVESLLSQTYRDIDIYVIDNASTDRSVESLENKFGDLINILVNEENLGGSGGFNRGLRTALEESYEYAVLIDNDVVLDQDAIGNMLSYMETHSDVGILGAKILQMQNPDIIQDIGGSITDRLLMHGNYYGAQDEGLPEYLESDYISTCTAMARMSAVKEFGIMPEDNFIYWDDVEWSKKCQLAGYKTVAIGNAKVWHNHSITGKVSSFVKYYITRNRLHYLAKYYKEMDADSLAKRFVSETFSQFLGFYMKNCEELAQVIFYAFDDFLHLKRGKCEQYKLMEIPERDIPFESVLDGKSNIKISFMDNVSDDEMDVFHVFLFIIGYIQKSHNYDAIEIDLSECKYSENTFREKLGSVIKMDHPNYRMPRFDIAQSDIPYDLELKMCNHVREVKQNILPIVYVDRYCNCIANERDYSLFHSAEFMEELFHKQYDDIAIQTVTSLRI